MAKAQKMRAAGSQLAGRAFLDEVARQTNQFFAPAGASNAGGAVEGGGASPSSAARGGRGYADLPADAKAFIAKMTPKLVGKGRAFETEAAYKKHYAEKYFAQF
jgi:hypothetical protein